MPRRNEASSSARKAALTHNIYTHHYLLLDGTGPSLLKPAIPRHRPVPRSPGREPLSPDVSPHVVAYHNYRLAVPYTYHIPLSVRSPSPLPW